MRYLIFIIRNIKHESLTDWLINKSLSTLTQTTVQEVAQSYDPGRRRRTRLENIVELHQEYSKRFDRTGDEDVH